MLIRSDRLKDMSVVGIQTGSRLAHLEAPIIDPRQLRILAFYCKGFAVKTNPAILHTEDIREIGDLGAIIDGADNIMSADDLVRLKEVIDLKFDLDDKEVVDDTGRKIGKVAGYAAEAHSFYIIKLYVRPNFLKALQTSEVIIDRSQIVELSAKRIVVKSPTVKEEEPVVAKPMPVVNNPFRQGSPQADAATPKDNS